MRGWAEYLDCSSTIPGKLTPKTDARGARVNGRKMQAATRTDLEPRMENFMDVNDRLTRLEDALIDLAVVVSGGHLDHLASANMSPVVVEAGRKLQAFHWAVIDEREL